MSEIENAKRVWQIKRDFFGARLIVKFSQKRKKFKNWIAFLIFHSLNHVYMINVLSFAGFSKNLSNFGKQWQPMRGTARQPSKRSRARCTGNSPKGSRSVTAYVPFKVPKSAATAITFLYVGLIKFTQKTMKKVIALIQCYPKQNGKKLGKREGQTIH